MENYISNPVVGLLQHTLRSLCHEKSLWIYAVFWRTLPRIYPPPNWDSQMGANKGTRENKKSWMLAWEDGFCNFFASATENCDVQHYNGIPPQLFFRMSHEIHNYGEGVIGKVAAERGHICIHGEQNKLTALQNSEDLHPRTWGAQFQSGIKTIALIAVDGGVLQLGAIKKVTEDLSYAVEVQKKFNYLLSIPGFLLPHPSYSTVDSTLNFPLASSSIKLIPHPGSFDPVHSSTPVTTMPVSSQSNGQLVMMTTPSMSSLETLLVKLPAAVPGPFSPPLFRFQESPTWFSSPENPLEGVVVGMEEIAIDEINHEKKHALD